MVKREIGKKALGVVIASILIFSIIIVLIPPTTRGVYLHPGTPNKTSVTKPATVTFNNINFTIRAAERINVSFLKFSIYKGSTELYTVTFNITGSELSDPGGKFTVTATSDTSDLPYNSTVGGYGYDEYTGTNTSFDYGYGYGSGSVDLTILYKIVYTTGPQTGTLHARLSVNCSNYTYASNPSLSTDFTVNAPSGGGGDDDDDTGDDDDDVTGDDDDDTTPPEEPGEEASEETIDDVNSEFGTNITEPFYVNDTDGDGEFDSFTDPNGELDAVFYTNISGNESVLISTDDDEVPEFFWDTASGEVTPVDYTPTEPVDEPYVDLVDQTVTIVINVNKTGWIYIEIADDYPELPKPTVETQDGRVIPPDQIFRANGKLYILDDPDTQYVIVYQYTLLEPTFSPATGTTITETQPTITVEYAEIVTITQALFGTDDVTEDLETADFMTYTYTPTTALKSGGYAFTVTAVDDDGNELVSTAQYTVDVGEEKPSEFPWLYAIIVVIIIIIVLFIVMLFKTGYLYVEDKEPPEAEKKKKK